MDCCGHGHALTYRPLIWRKALTSVSAMLAGDVGPRGSTAAAQTAETASAALDVLRKSISVDVHTHGGKTGIMSKGFGNGLLPSTLCASQVSASAVSGFSMRIVKGGFRAIRCAPFAERNSARSMIERIPSETT
jgi:hypothetical protein